MTIKEFADLCGCNPQTLRYYDRVDLLKPVEVDLWTGYRRYEKEQALVFVRIRNLQKAGFTIAEIRQLLGREDREIYRAFEAKIAEAERRPREIKTIQRSYRTEMDQIIERIKEVREQVAQDMQGYDPTVEFGIDEATYAEIKRSVQEAFDALTENVPEEFSYSSFDDADAQGEEIEYLDLLNNPAFAVVFEQHGWTYVKDFLDSFSELEDGAEYALLFRLAPDKYANTTPLGNTILGILLLKNPHKKRNLSANFEPSEDGQNHFWLLKRIVGQ